VHAWSSSAACGSLSRKFPSHLKNNLSPLTHEDSNCFKILFTLLYLFEITIFVCNEQLDSSKGTLAERKVNIRCYELRFSQ
jgi:hypothetical protein